MKNPLAELYEEWKETNYMISEYERQIPYRQKTIRAAIALFALALLFKAGAVFAFSGEIFPDEWYTDTVYTCANGDGTPDLGTVFEPDGDPIIGLTPVDMCDSGQYFDLAAYPDAAAWLANFNAGVYGTYHLVQFDAATSVCNGAPDYATCIAGMDYDSDFAFEMINAVTPPPDPTPDLATSTVDQTQLNLAAAFFIFMWSLFGMVWLIRKH